MTKYLGNEFFLAALSDYDVPVFVCFAFGWMFYNRKLWNKNQKPRVLLVDAVQKIVDPKPDLDALCSESDVKAHINRGWSSVNDIIRKSSCLRDREHIVVGIAGGSGSGKTTLAFAVAEALGKDNITFISHDSYYRDISHLSLDERCQNNFDHPDSLETSLLVTHLQQLKNDQTVCIPRYDYATHSRMEGLEEVRSKRVIILEGILIFSDP